MSGQKFKLSLILLLVAAILIVTLRCASGRPSGVVGMKYNVLNNVLRTGELRRIDALSKGVKWTTGRHANHPTTDITVSDIWELDRLMCEKLRQVIIPEICKLFDVKFESLWLRDMFLVKYEHGAQKSLSLRRHATELSLVLHVNPRDEFDGGGT